MDAGECMSVFTDRACSQLVHNMHLYPQGAPGFLFALLQAAGGRRTAVCVCACTCHPGGVTPPPPPYGTRVDMVDLSGVDLTRLVDDRLREYLVPVLEVRACVCVCWCCWWWCWW